VQVLVSKLYNHQTPPYLWGQKLAKPVKYFFHALRVPGHGIVEDVDVKAAGGCGCMTTAGNTCPTVEAM